jgi:hypothetical protein
VDVRWSGLALLLSGCQLVFPYTQGGDAGRDRTVDRRVLDVMEGRPDGGQVADGARKLDAVRKKPDLIVNVDRPQQIDVAHDSAASVDDLSPLAQDLGSLTCAAMSLLYSQTLPLARQCTTVLPVQCTVAVAATLGCPCPTYVNPGAATLKLQSLMKRWQQDACSRTCPMFVCAALSGQCTGGAGTSVCTDVAGP